MTTSSLTTCPTWCAQDHQNDPHFDWPPDLSILHRARPARVMSVDGPIEVALENFVDHPDSGDELVVNVGGLLDLRPDEAARLADALASIVRELTEAGMSTRAIAPVVGVSKDTVHRDQVSQVRHLPQPSADAATAAPTARRIWHTTTTAAEVVARYHGTIRKACEAGELHGVQRVPGGRWRIHDDCLQAWACGESCAHQRDGLR